MRRFTIGDLEQTSEYCANYNIEIYMEYIYGNTSTHFLGWHCSETCSRSWGMLPSRPGTSLPTYRTTLHLHHRSTVYNTWNPRVSAVHIFPTQRVDETQCGQGMLMDSKDWVHRTWRRQSLDTVTRWDTTTIITKASTSYQGVYFNES